ncbi:MAG: hypothetical protein IPP02_01285 [Chitinophagaceae bacterium]|mgnify:CR=1 FL=1|nr:hypothetical protein [Chitinophagaceae bacterium]MBK7679272.1 hypothetical protein [Chitinophagaceae bacterium]MBK8299386.1 hypothetical protein [Chitinophagaceae bacterium]MBK9463435.1 hypothetical protein [Chitinophagaceae bacterium]MBK9659442.1 hypothetical protein [Chitinophagaceae bacterium]
MKQITLLLAIILSSLKIIAQDERILRSNNKPRVDILKEITSDSAKSLSGSRTQLDYSNEIIDKKINALNQKITDLNNKIDNLIALFQTHKHTYHVMAFKEVTTFGDLRNQINQNLSGSDKKLIGLQIHGVDVQTSPPK